MSDNCPNKYEKTDGYKLLQGDPDGSFYSLITVIIASKNVKKNLFSAFFPMAGQSALNPVFSVNLLNSLKNDWINQSVLD